MNLGRLDKECLKEDINKAHKIASKIRDSNFTKCYIEVSNEIYGCTLFPRVLSQARWNSAYMVISSLTQIRDCLIIAYQRYLKKYEARAKKKERLKILEVFSKENCKAYFDRLRTIGKILQPLYYVSIKMQEMEANLADTLQAFINLY